MTITEDLIRQLQEREQRGIATYGETLQPHNGRDATQDLLEELLDAAQYARQWQIEREASLVACENARLWIWLHRDGSEECEGVLRQLRRVLGKETTE